MADFSVVVRKNDSKETYLGTLAADLSHEQAVALAVSMNAMFAEHRLNWFARAKQD